MESSRFAEYHRYSDRELEDASARLLKRFTDAMAIHHYEYADHLGQACLDILVELATRHQVNEGWVPNSNVNVAAAAASTTSSAPAA